MSNTRMRRWLMAGMTGALVALTLVLGAGSVAADTTNNANTGLVQRFPGQDAQSPIQVVSSPGFVQSGTQANPFTGQVVNSAGQVVQYAPANNGNCAAGCGYYGPGYYGPGYGYPVGGYYYGGYGYPVNGVTYGPGACGAGYCGYAAAGPIVGYDAHGNPIVYDVRGGTFDTYTTDKNGRVCEADSQGNCQPGQFGPGS